MSLEKTVEENCVYDGKVVRVFCNKSELENGNVVTREVVEHNGGVGILPIDSEGNVYLVRQYRVGASEELIEIPAGKLDAPDEPKIECAYRELEEETGYRSENLEWMITLRTTVAFCNERIEVFVAKNLK